MPKWSHVLGRKFPTRRLCAWVRLWRFRALDESFAILTFHEPLNFYDPPMFVFFLMMWVFLSGWLKWRLRAIKTSHVAGLRRRNQNSQRGKGQKNSLMHIKDETRKTRAAALGFSSFLSSGDRRAVLTWCFWHEKCDGDDDDYEQVVRDSPRFPEFRGDPHLERIWPHVMKASAAEPKKLRWTASGSDVSPTVR